MTTNCPSIEYRTRKEILNENLSDHEVNEYQQKALRIMLVPGWQKEGIDSKAAQAMGFEIIRASLFAQAGLYQYDFVHEWVEVAFEKLYEWLPLPPAYIKAGSQLVAPLGSMIHPINSEFNEQYGFWWFHFHELAARMGMLSEKSLFRKNLDLVDDMQLEQIAENIKRANQRTAYTGWGAYSGLALNSDWKSKQNRISDLAFRICLTQHYGDR